MLKVLKQIFILGKKDPFNLTPNITPIKEAIPEKKILVRSFSKGNLIGNGQENNKRTPQIINPKKNEKPTSINGIFLKENFHYFILKDNP